MTTTAVQGRTATLLVQWFEFAGGPSAVVTGVGITITPVAGGAAVIGPTSFGVAEPATGVNTYQWSVSSGQNVGDYLVLWTGTDSQGESVQATEIVTVVSSSAPGSGPCESWEPLFTCDLPTGASAVSGAALQAATEALYALSGRQYGLCTVTLRPCRQDCYGEVWPAQWARYGAGSSYPQPALVRGLWYNLACGSCGDNCTCGILDEVALPGPVRDVVEVKIDGVALVKNVDYRLDDFRLLVRLGGNLWPVCNDLALDDTRVGTWSVTIRTGQDVPKLGRYAVGELTTELTKLFLCNEDCALPKPIQSLSRQGVSVTFFDPNVLFADGKIGLTLSDLFIQTVNPGKLRRPARVYDIDSPLGNRRLTGTG